MDAKSALEILWNRRKVVAIALAAGLLVALIVALRVRAGYTATASVLIVPGAANDTDGVTTTTTKPLVSDDLPMLAQTSIVLGKVSQDLGGGLSPDALAQRIRAEVYENSNVMRIRFAGGSAQEAVKGANSVADAVVSYYRTIATSRFDSLAADLKRQLSRRQQQLRDIDTKLQRASAAYPYVEDAIGGTNGTSIEGLLVRLQTERDELSATLSGDIAQASVTNQRAAESTALARQELANQDPFFRNVQEQYGRDAAQMRLVRTQFSSHYPGLPELQDIVKGERAALSNDEQKIGAGSLSGTQSYAAALAEENHAHSLVASDRAKLQQIDDTIAEVRRELTDPTSGGVSVAALRRDREAAESAYQLLSARLNTVLADRAAAASTGSLIVFDYASYAPASPYTRPALITAAILMVTLWIAVTLAFVLEHLDRRFRSGSIIENVYGTPVLGVI